MSSYRLNAGAARRVSSTPRRTKVSADIVIPRRWTLAAGASLAVGGYVVMQCLLAGAPVAASLLGAALVAIALLLYCAILFWVLDSKRSWGE